jgi:UDP-N-acetylglucosamine--N-acetylmuramyl-(pentapeptide) pyrophosphoryl-undecaprenol N-acetylglucosamine transferase
MTESVAAGATFAIITGGGTSGHVIPALAIADALVAAGHSRDSIHYVGGRSGVETKLVARTAYPATFLDVVGLQRSLSRRNLWFVPKLVRAVRAARRLLRDVQPAVVVNVGGYASFPATYAARRAKVPYVVVSWDHRPGLVSRLMAPRAAACAVASADSSLVNAEVTGAPVRAEMVGLDRAQARASARDQLGLPADRFVVAVVCGSLGAASINAVLAETAERLASRKDLALYHAVGERFLNAAAPGRDGKSGILYRVIGYETRMAQLYAAADLFITRAGAGTLAELTTVGAPAIVVPWPQAADDHQLANADLLSKKGAVVLIEQRDFTPERVMAEIDRFASSPNELAALATRARAAGAIHRSGKLVALVERVAKGKGADR